jgi:hypothetical protein
LEPYDLQLLLRVVKRTLSIKLTEVVVDASTVPVIMPPITPVPMAEIAAAYIGIDATRNTL